MTLDSPATIETETASAGSVQRLVSRLVVAFGGGVNSTAMLVEMKKRAIIPDLILFADTGGERPDTYRTVWLVSEWCKLNGLPPILTVRNPGPTLEEDCLTRKALPSIAYGFKSCSDRWKQRPQNHYIKRIWPHGLKPYTKAIGFDAGEWVRMRDADDPNCTNWYPLVDWKLHREECEAICVQAGLPVAKSSCFFCPSMRKPEVLALAKQNPELLARAVAMEENAELTTVKGLGRHWSWKNLVKSDADQMRLFSDAGTPEIACGCYDG